MAINALNSGAKVWLADLEDANTPHWVNVVSGQVNLADAVREKIVFTSPEGREYALKPGIGHAVIVVRPRGWHLDKRHLTFDGRTVRATVLIETIPAAFEMEEILYELRD